MAHFQSRRQSTRLGVIALVVAVVCALVGDRETRAEQNAVPARSGSASPASSGAVAPPSGKLPVVVNIPPGVTSPEDARPFFDDFSWRSFIALNWPAVPGQHGVPKSPNDPKVFLTAGTSYPTVWGSYREAYELYRTDAAPIAFDGAATTNTVCGPAASGTKILLMAAKSGSLLQDVDQAFSYPLVDQNNNYVYYEIRFNADQYEFVRSNGLYLSKNLMAAEMKAPIAMPISSAQPYRQGAVMLKAAWKQMTSSDDPSRYYTVKAKIYDTSQRQPVCRDVTMGLIGFHIGHKVDGFAQWIWSSFEQIDNVPNDDGSKPTNRMTLNNGSADPKTDGGWANRPDSKHLLAPDKRVKAQVTRLNPIPTTPSGRSTADINTAYRKALASTVWTNYQLVITQWPATPVPQSQFKPKENQGVYPKDAGGPFPVNNAVNTALETFFQSQSDAAGAGGNSCMQCHYGAGLADFSWSLVLRSR
ncbi:hypothetical protein JQ625_05190 [Bradyrhizobium diazoefficiens]|nr:hypothetical protein [Bradyrhizobium diazoefficiens]MBR0774220.1 hypothetical protein [Bradyrhizobium diazoefficiens]